jgi:hypothetical protein
LNAVLETQRLQAELANVNRDNVTLEGKLNHARLLLDKEKKKRLEAERNSAALVRKLKTLADMIVPAYLSDLGSCRD